MMDSDEDENNMMRTAHGYEDDGFVVDDDDMEEEEEEEDDQQAFAPLPKHRPARPAGQKPTRPIPTDTRIESLPDVHQDLVHSFVQEAQRLEEKIRNRKELRRPLFTERDFRTMAVNWTLSIEKMKRIPGIDVAKVKEHGPKLLEILKQHHLMYKETMCASGEASASSHDQDIVDLISSEGEMEDEEDEDNEDSHYFNQSTRSDVQAFHERLQGLADSQPVAPQRKTSSSYPKAGAKKWGGKKWPKKGTGGGVTKRRAASGASGGRRSSAGPSSAAAGSSAGAPKRDGKIVRKTGGAIGLMPM